MCAANKDSVEGATHYKYKSNYYIITRRPIVYGEIAFFSWFDGITFK